MTYVYQTTSGYCDRPCVPSPKGEGWELAATAYGSGQIYYTWRRPAPEKREARSDEMLRHYFDDNGECPCGLVVP